MGITFDEDLMYLDKKKDKQLLSIKQTIDALKVKGDTAFCKKCCHIMHISK